MTGGADQEFLYLNGRAAAPRAEASSPFRTTAAGSQAASVPRAKHTHLEPDTLECEVKWALESITMNKASGGDGIPVELFQILKDDAVKVLHSICQQIWKAQQWPQEIGRAHV